MDLRAGEQDAAVRHEPAATTDGYWSDALSSWSQDRPQTLWRSHSDAVNAALVRRWLRGNGSVLKTDLWDEAVGEGLYPALAAAAAEVIGIDSSQEVVDRACARYPMLDGFQADVRRLPFPDERFDGIVSNSTLDHLNSTDEIVLALRELRRVLRPGGELVITLDNPLNPFVALTKALPRSALHRIWLRFARASGRIGFLPYFVGATLGPRRLARILRAEGFELRERGAIVHAPRVVAVFAGSFLERRGRPRTQRLFLALLRAFERLEALPSRYLTGHFVAVRALRGPEPSNDQRLRNKRRPSGRISTSGRKRTRPPDTA